MPDVPPPSEYQRDIPAVLEFLDSLTAQATGPMHAVGTQAWKDADHATKLASVANYASSTIEELNPAVIAARLAAEIAQARRAEALARRDASHDVAGATDWRKVADTHIPRDELERRRAQPGPLAGLETQQARESLPAPRGSPRPERRTQLNRWTADDRAREQHDTPAREPATRVRQDHS